jgi:hypothetical protein
MLEDPLWASNCPLGAVLLSQNHRSGNLDGSGRAFLAVERVITQLKKLRPTRIQISTDEDQVSPGVHRRGNCRLVTRRIATRIAKSYAPGAG